MPSSSDLPGAFLLAQATVKSEPRITEAFRSGKGVGLARARSGSVRGNRAVLPAGVRGNLVPTWIPALEGIQAGSRRAAGSPTSAVATAPRPSSWPRRIPSRASSASTTTRRRSSGRAQAREGEAGRPRQLRGREREGLPRHGLRSRGFFDCAPRHGRSGRRGSHVRGRSDRRAVAARRALRERPARGQPEPGRPDVLRRVHHGLHAELARAGSRRGPRRAGRRGAARAVPPRRASRGSAVRPRPRSIWCSKPAPEGRQRRGPRGPLRDRPTSR